MELYRRLHVLQFQFHLILLRAAAGIVKKSIVVMLKFLLGSSFEPETQVLIAQAVNFGDAETRN